MSHAHVLVMHALLYKKRHAGAAQSGSQLWPAQDCALLQQQHCTYPTCQYKPPSPIKTYPSYKTSPLAQVKTTHTGLGMEKVLASTMLLLPSLPLLDAEQPADALWADGPPSVATRTSHHTRHTRQLATRHCCCPSAPADHPMASTNYTACSQSCCSSRSSLVRYAAQVTRPAAGWLQQSATKLRSEAGQVPSLAPSGIPWCRCTRPAPKSSIHCSHGSCCPGRKPQGSPRWRRSLTCLLTTSISMMHTASEGRSAASGPYGRPAATWELI